LGAGELAGLRFSICNGVYTDLDYKKDILGGVRDARFDENTGKQNDCVDRYGFCVFWQLFEGLQQMDHVYYCWLGLGQNAQGQG
jgi:hypothetical protein